MNDTEQLWTDYWREFYAYVSKNSDVIRPLLPASPPARHYMWIDTDCPIDIEEARYVPQILVQKRLIRVGLVLDKKDAPLRFRSLNNRRARIEEELGERLQWGPAPRAKFKHNIELVRYSNPRNRGLWDEQHQWLLERLENFHRVVSPMLRGMII